MKKSSLLRKIFICFSFSLLLTAVFGPAVSLADELTPESDIITLAVPSSGQTLNPPYTPSGGRYQETIRSHDLAVAKDGSFVVTWVYRAPDSSKDAFPFPVYARCFNPDGTPRTEIIEVCNGYAPEDNISNRWSRVACDDDGNFVVCWIRYDPTERSGDVTSNIYARLFNSEGVPRGDEFLVYTGQYVFGPEIAAVSMNDSGAFVVSWETDIPDTHQKPILAKRFNSDGEPLDQEYIKVRPVYEVYRPFSLLFYRPSVAMNSDGGFVAAWTTDSLIFATSAISESYVTSQMIRQFNKNGSPMGLARKVNAIHFQSLISLWAPQKIDTAATPPVIAMNSSGEFAVSYSRFSYYTYETMNVNYEEAGYRFYTSKGRALGAKKKLEAYMRRDSLVNTMDKNGNLIMAWFGCEDKSNCVNDEAICLMQTTNGIAASKNIVRVVDNLEYDPLENTPDISYPSLDVSDDGHIVVIWHDNENILGRIYSVQ